MATSISFNISNTNETQPIISDQVQQPPSLSNSKKIVKPFPTSIIQSIEANRRQRIPPASQSISNFVVITPSSFDVPDENDRSDRSNPTILNRTDGSQDYLINSSQRKRSPSEVRVELYSSGNSSANESLTNSQLEVSKTKYKGELRSSDPSLLDRKHLKQSRSDYFRRTFLERRFARRIHSAYASSSTLRSTAQRRSTQNLASRNRRQLYRLPRNSKWHIVRNRLHEIAMMSESYARMRAAEQDLRWTALREKIRLQVLDMREMSLLRQQDDGVKVKKKLQKSKFDLKAIPIDEIIHVEREGRVYSMRTRDLVLGRLLCDEEVELDTFAQLDARRQFQVQQHLVKQQEGRTRLKKQIAFSFCLCNLSFIMLMFAAMLIFATKTIFELAL